MCVLYVCIVYIYLRVSVVNASMISGYHLFLLATFGFALSLSLSVFISLFVAVVSCKFVRPSLFGCVHSDSVCGSVGMISR